MTIISAKVIADSVTTTGIRITTLELTYPRSVHSEFMTHRVFSRNAASSRAIPISKTIQGVCLNPATPIHWGAHQKGMQADYEMTGIRLTLAKFIWKMHRWNSLASAWMLNKLGAHKQLANRLLEVHNHITVLVTSTKWANFMALRDHVTAEPIMQELARQIMFARSSSAPRVLKDGEWHLPYVSKSERDAHIHIDTLLKVSTARCARLSYKSFNGGTGKTSTPEEDKTLFKKLLGSSPLHASPAEHQARADPDGRDRDLWGNFHGWIQYRKMLPMEQVKDELYR